MASYRYTVTIQEPVTRTAFVGGAYIDSAPAPIVRSFDGSTGNIPFTRAIEFARSQHKRPDGTTITITRRLRPNACGDGTGPELPYRKYVIQGGFVRRVDR